MARPQHATFAHDVLRDSALADPLFFLWACHRDDATERFTNIWRRCAGAEPIDEAGLSVSVHGDGPIYLALITLPEATEIIEAHYVAVVVVVPHELLDDAEQQAPTLPAKSRLERALKVILGSTTPEARAGWGVPVRYFTLERGMHLDEATTPRTVLCEWRVEGEGEGRGPRHLNYGDGPPKDQDLFITSVLGHLMQHKGGEA